MGTIDWKTLGLVCGLEIHQQLEGKKLYCPCPTIIREDPPHKQTIRELRAAAGEAGTVDVAALQEAQKQRVFTYETYIDTTCLVELDEEPPHTINTEALETALLFAKMTNARILDCAQAMRKTIIDGSNTSGFQRTTLIATNGTIETSFGTVGINTIILEEDSARNIKETSGSVTYRLDRLGIPLIEVCTAPDLHTPEQARETAEHIGLLLRSTGKAKRGLGTIRQDVNVSIKNGARVEIKGAQDLRLITTLVENEALRQHNLLAITEEIHKRKVPEHTTDITDISKDLKNSTAKIINTTIQQGGKILACKITSCAGLLGRETQPGKRLGTELSDRAKIIAGVGGIFHSDELPKYGITEDDIASIRGTLRCNPNDAFVIVAAQEKQAKQALNAVIQRMNEAKQGVPSEVRKTNDDGTTSYLRPMPGAARMYPETDVPIMPLDAKKIAQLSLPELIEKRQQRYEKAGLTKDMALTAAKSEQWKTLDVLVSSHKNLKPAYIAEIFFGAEKAIKTQYNIEINPTHEDFDTLLAALESQTISKESVIEILKENKPIQDIIKKYTVLTDKELEKKIKEIITTHKNIPPNALIGIAMKELRGKASGQKIAEMIKKYSI